MTSTFQVHQVRYGLATNSSSTHSILILPGVDKDKEADGGFGWDFFTAATKESKGLYAALQLRYALLSMFNEDIAQTVAQAWTGVDLTEPGSYEQYIDHQSTWVLPCSWDGKGIDKAFFDDLHTFLMRDDVLVLGGNDNTNKRHPLTKRPNAQTVDFPLPLEGSNKGLVCRKDPVAGYWTIFNRNNGTKIRMSFGEANGGSVTPTKAHAPELVDLKITNWCGAGCEFCLEPATPVLMADLTWKAIGTVVEGDRLVAFDEEPVEGQKTRRMRESVVEKVWTTKKQAMRVTTDQGEIVCSTDHRFLVGWNTKEGGGRWRRAEKIRLGNTILFGSSPWEGSAETADYMRGWIQGMVDGDGTVKWEPTPNQRQVWWRVALTDLEALERLGQYLTALGVAHGGIKPFRQEDERGQAMDKIEIRSRSGLDAVRACVEGPETTDYKRGYLGGFYDAEGSLCGGDIIRLFQTKPNGHIERVERYLADLGFDGVRESNGVRVRGGMWENLRFLGMMRPAITRKVDPRWKDKGYNQGQALVTKLELLEEQSLVDIQTSTRTFYANGFASHNCYQDSTPTGLHGDRDFINSILRALGTMRVFEVAIGGGEPTAHPEFVEILRTCRHHGMVPNFTSKAKAWLHDHKRRAAILEHTGAFAFSIDNAEDLDEIASARDTYGIPGSQVNCQLVMGTVNEYEFEEILEHAASRSMRLTLLGYKTNGRGSQVKPQDYSGWAGIFKKVRDRSRFGLKLGIDTALAQESVQALEALEVPSWCYEVKEGSFSMYIDAVTRKTAASSYGENLAMRPLKSKDAYNGLTEEILSHFVEY
jgi:hypothetical protein